MGGDANVQLQILYMLPLRWRREARCPAHSWFNKTGPLRMSVWVCVSIFDVTGSSRNSIKETVLNLHLQRPPAEELSHKLSHASSARPPYFHLTGRVTGGLPSLLLAQPETRASPKHLWQLSRALGERPRRRWHKQMMRKPQPGWSRQQVTEKLQRAAANYECTAAVGSRAGHWWAVCDGPSLHACTVWK